MELFWVIVVVVAVLAVIGVAALAYFLRNPMIR